MDSFQPLGIGVGSLVNNRYELLRKLGSGAMSAVYLVADRALNNDTIALKLFAPGINADQKLVERIHNEVLITRKLGAPNIVRTYDFGQTREGLFFMTMEYVEGVTLDRLAHAAPEHRPAFPDIVRMLRDIAAGMSYAHKHDVIHRDLKPANVLVSVDGEVKIADFGLARALNIAQDLTQVGECVGTPYYMSPEQIQGQEIDARTDVYSLGIIAYELLVGRTPFHEQSWFNLAQQIIKSPLPELPRSSRVPRWYQEFVQKCTAKLPDQRFADADEVIEYLDEKIANRDFAGVPRTEGSLPNILGNIGRRSRAARGSSGVGIRGSSLRASHIFVVASLAMLLLLAVALTRGQGVMPPSLEQSAQTMNGMADTMNKMTRFVAFMVENKDKIEQLSQTIDQTSPQQPGKDGAAAPTQAPSVEELRAAQQKMAEQLAQTEKMLRESAPPSK